MMRHASAVLNRGLPRADIQIAVNLLRIGVDDFTVEFGRDIEGDIAFAYGRRPQDDDQLRFHSS